MNLLCVPPDRAAEAWPVAARHVKAATSGTGMVEDDFAEREVLEGRALLWLAVEGTKVIGAGITRLVIVRGELICEIFAWGSDDQRRCASLLSTIEEFARAEGCAAVRLAGRKGWVRSLPEYRLKAVILERRL
jgi:hypothetical protein